MPESNNEEIAARQKRIESIEREIAALKELGTTKQGDSGIINKLWPMNTGWYFYFINFF